MPRMRHPDMGAVIEAPDSAEAMLVGSGWQKVTKTEAAEMDKAAAAEAAADEAAMRPAEPAAPQPEDEAPAARRPAAPSEEN